VFLASIAQRTRRLRFGPLVYLLPLYHPLRLAEEIAMLDHLSQEARGRIGRGVPPIELMLYGQNVDEAQSVYEETLAVIQLAFTQERLTHKGKHFDFRDYRSSCGRGSCRIHLSGTASARRTAPRNTAARFNAVTLAKASPPPC